MSWARGIDRARPMTGRAEVRRPGLITKGTRPASDPLQYAICPVIKDPTDGGIAPDQFLAYTRWPDDGSPLEPGFLLNFESLQLTGDWAD